jgi:hypothetical protein
MQLRVALIHALFAILFVCVFAPSPACQAQSGRGRGGDEQYEPQPPQMHTGTGKITSLSEGYVTIEVHLEDLDTPMAIVFSITPNTKITGKLAVGATATVKYHTDPQGKVIASEITVRSPS